MLTTNQTEINLGNLKYGKSYNFKYVLTNTYPEAITISHIIVGCGSCTTASVNKQILATGESADLNVVFTPGSTGMQTKGITVRHNINSKPNPDLNLKFKATVDG